MDLKKLSPSKIETILYDRMKSLIDIETVSFKGQDIKPIFAGKRNSQINFDQMIYCNCPVSINDLSAYAKTWARVEIYQKKQSSGFEDKASLTSLHDKIIDAVGDNGFEYEDYFFEFRNEIKSDDDAQFSYIFIILYCTIS